MYECESLLGPAGCYFALTVGLSHRYLASCYAKDGSSTLYGLYPFYICSIWWHFEILLI